MASEIREDDDQVPCSIQEKEAEKIKIRQIIDYQKSLYFSSSSRSSFSSASTSCSSSSSSKSSSLLDLMRGGSAPLGRLFSMEHTSLEKHFKEYSGSPLIRPILLWGSDSDGDDPWAGFEHASRGFGPTTFLEDESRLSSRGNSGIEELQQGLKRKLHRAKSYKRLPRFSFWRCGRFRVKMRLVRFKLKVLIRRRIS